jgi:preprotein translocase subunit SecB
MNKAAFSLDHYFFSKVKMDLSDVQSKNDVNISFLPSGVFDNETSKFYLSLIFKAKYKNKRTNFIEIDCKATYKFSQIISLDEIPPFFFVNCIAIIFPYVRAYISTVSLQANVSPIVLPTMNLTDLAEPLKKNTVSK